MGNGKWEMGNVGWQMRDGKCGMERMRKLFGSWILSGIHLRILAPLPGRNLFLTRDPRVPFVPHVTPGYSLMALWADVEGENRLTVSGYGKPPRRHWM